MADFDNFFKLRLQSLQKNPSSFLSSYEEEEEAGGDFFEKILQSNNDKNVIFGAFANDNMIGMVGIYQESAIKAAHKSHLWGMYVESDYREQGVGKSLLEVAIKHAKENMKCLSVDLIVETTNIAAKNLYAACGFKIWGTETNAMRIGHKFYDKFHMSLSF